MSEQPRSQPPQPPGIPPRRSILGDRLASRQAALGRGLDVLLGGSTATARRLVAEPQPEAAPPDDDSEATLVPGGPNRGALLSRLQGSHQADLTRGFRALLNAGLGGGPQWDAPPEPIRPLMSAPEQPAAEAPIPPTGAAEYQVRLIKLRLIQPNPHQPRGSISEESIARLAQSIRELGLLQPLVVMPAPGSRSGEYQIVSGERRRRAAELAGLVDIPAIVREVAPGAALQLALTEDLHSAPLPALDRARLYARLTREMRLPISEVASRLGLTAAEIESKLLFLSLDYEMLQSLETGQLSEEQADQLVTIEDEGLRRRAWRNAIRHGWSAERIAAAITRWSPHPPDSMPDLPR